MIAQLVQRGYSDRILLSHDDPVWAGLLTDDDQARHKAANPHLLAFVAAVALPALESRGVRPEEIRKMTVDNPREWLVAS
jgi:predicted metal-dependent phosphotriesterase family hydrolase